jgi:hypothetical protein
MQWLHLCSLYFTHQTEAPTTERSKVAKVISLLTGRALEWATAVWERGEEELDSYEGFMALFKGIFYHPPEGRVGVGTYFNYGRGTRRLPSMLSLSRQWME